MIRPLLARLAVAVGVLALSLTAGAGVAFAEPPFNTTCSYDQMMRTLDAHLPGGVAQLNASPVAQSWVQRYVASPPDQREQMYQQAWRNYETERYAEVIDTLAKTCDEY
jgi:hemophore-related protein